MSQEFYEATIDKPIYEDDILAKKGLVGKTLTLDTRNKDVCEKVRDSLLRRFKDKKFLDLCKDSDQPLVSITVFEDNPKQLKFFIKEREEESKAISNKSVGEKLIDQTRTFAAGGLFMMGLIYALPTSISNWDKDDIKKNGLAKWKRNVKEGPVVDKDD